MSNIKIMSEALASQIAAGEVVERPASIVKELIENSLDANAKRITIEIHNGGKSLIRVTDDGSGMGKVDALLSLERHATSKIKKSDDLFNIATLGFRGEALPSIASISRTELLTSDGESSTLIKCEGNRIISNVDSSSPRGTTVIVKDIFFNTPARLKYLKSDGVELSHVSEIVSKFIISSPDVSFKLLSNGREVMFSSGNGSLIDAITSIFGSQFAKNLIEVKGEKLKGFISKPSDTRATRDYQTFFVNGRIVKNYMLSKAAESAYENLIPKDRHPSLILFIDIDPKDIDVNVHPAKKEIRFEKPKIVANIIAESVRDALCDTAKPSLISRPVFIRNPMEEVVSLEAISDEFSLSSSAYEISSGEAVQNEVELTEAESSAATPAVAAQIALTYIVCVDPDGLILIDQHAAHERILYEKIKKGGFSKDLSQFLLMPEIIEFPAQEFISLENSLLLLSELGFDIEPFGKNSFRVKAVPSLLTKTELKPLLSDIAANIKSEEIKINIDGPKEKIAKLVACHGAVKAGDRLNHNEMTSLVKDLFSCDNFSTCPHGRPSIIKIENSKIASFFGR